MVEPPVERLRAKYAAKHYNFDGTWRRPKDINDGSWKRIQHAINSEFMVEEKDLPLARCFASAFEFLDVNRAADPWFLMLECFDPHEPFQAPTRFKEAYATGWSGGVLDWRQRHRDGQSPSLHCIMWHSLRSRRVEDAIGSGGGATAIGDILRTPGGG